MIYIKLLNRTRVYKLKLNEQDKKILNEFIADYNFIVKGFIKLNKLKLKKENKYLTIHDMNTYKNELKKLPIVCKYNSYFLNDIIYYLSKNIKNIDKLDDVNICSYRGFKYNKSENIFCFNYFKEKFFFKTFNKEVLEDEIISFFIKKDLNGYYIYINYRKKIVDSIEKKELRFVGIDVGLQDFAILSNKTKIPNPRYYRKLENDLSISQKKLSSLTYKSKNWEKQKIKVRKINKKIFNYRKDFLHKITTYIIQNFDVIGLEDLKIEKMVKNKKYSKSILDAGWGTFMEMLSYKAEEKNKIIIKVDRFYPSSQICSKCGSKKIMPVHMRTFKCGNCNLEIDRDYNASINIENKIKEIYYKK